MLLNLFVGRITYEDTQEINNPLCGSGKECGFDEFKKEVHDISWNKCEFVTQMPEVDVGPPLEDSKAKDLRGLVETQKAKLDLSKTDDSYQLSSPQEVQYFLKCSPTGKYPELGKFDYYYSFSGATPESVRKTKTGEVKKVCKENKAIIVTVDGNDLDFDATDATFAGGYNGIGDVEEGDRVIVGYREKKTTAIGNTANAEKIATSVSRSTRVMLLRSPEAILYYLGEIMRVRTKTNEAPLVSMEYRYPEKCQTQPVELFSARKGDAGPEGKPPVRVKYENENYVIPYVNPDQMCTSDESMHVLSLMSLLIAKQQSASQLPAPVGVTTTIGR